MKIHEKLIISFFLVSFIPILILGTVTIVHFKNFSLESTSREIHNNLNTMKLRIWEITNEAVNIANKLMIDQRLKEILLFKYKTPMEAYLMYSQYREIENFKTLYARAISHIRIYSENPTILENGIFYKETENIRSKPWYRLAKKLNGLIRWELVYHEKDLYPGYYFSLVRLLKDVYNEKFGVLVIDLNNLELKSILNFQPFDTFILNDENIVVASNNESLIGKKMDFNIYEIINKGSAPISYNSQKFQAFIHYLPLIGDNKDFYIASMVPLEFIMKEPMRMQYFALTIIFISVILSIFLIFLLSKTMSSRISTLNKAVNEISKGNWDLEIPIKGRDEIGELADSVKSMAKSIKKLIEEVYIANIQKSELLLKQKDIKLKLLTNQLNPHFLFNTLETIHMMAVCNNQKEIADISLKLGNLLRKILELKGNLINLEAELELVKDYLEIQKYRFRRIDYKINIYEDIKDVYILPFLIQPIVENSIIHGLEGKKDKGFINITVGSKEDKLIISIEDNGKGMNKEEINSLIEDLNSNNVGEKTGLKNTWERIKLFYGEEYGLKIQSEKGKGTKVDIILPFLKENSKDV